MASIARTFMPDNSDAAGASTGKRQPPIRVAVVGARGRMGTAVSEAVEAAEDMRLVSRLDAGQSLNRFELDDPDVAIEFTVPAVTEDNVHALLDLGISVVVGTTGWDEPMLERVREHVERAGHEARAQGKRAPGVIIAPNFAISAVLAIAFARKAAALFESAEVIELHHPDKVDAPSGTAVSTAKAIAATRKDAGVAVSPDATEQEIPGARGADVDGVRVHAVRLRGLLAHEEIVFGNAGEQLTIRADSYNRNSFLPGVLLATREVLQRPGLTYGLAALLNLD